jgi:hypothetical protein
MPKKPELQWKKVHSILGMDTYQVAVHDGFLSVICSVDDGKLHMSISHQVMVDGKNRPGRYPTWDEIKEARYRFMPVNTTAAMFLPPMDEYVNVHSTTFHLWELKSDNTR